MLVVLRWSESVVMVNGEVADRGYKRYPSKRYLIQHRVASRSVPPISASPLIQVGLVERYFERGEEQTASCQVLPA